MKVDDYDVVKVIGRGAFGEVQLVRICSHLDFLGRRIITNTIFFLKYLCQQLGQASSCFNAQIETFLFRFIIWHIACNIILCTAFDFCWSQCSCSWLSVVKWLDFFLYPASSSACKNLFWEGETFYLFSDACTLCISVLIEEDIFLFLSSISQLIYWSIVNSRGNCPQILCVTAGKVCNFYLAAVWGLRLSTEGAGKLGFCRWCHSLCSSEHPDSNTPLFGMVPFWRPTKNALNSLCQLFKWSNLFVRQGVRKKRWRWEGSMLTQLLKAYRGRTCRCWSTAIQVLNLWEQERTYKAVNGWISILNVSAVLMEAKRLANSWNSNVVMWNSPHTPQNKLAQ